MTTSSSIPHWAGPASPALSCRAAGRHRRWRVPGIRLKAQLSDRITAYFAVFDGDLRRRDRKYRRSRIRTACCSGSTIRLGSSAQVKYGFDIGPNAPLPASVAAGAWYHMGTFDSLSA